MEARMNSINRSVSYLIIVVSFLYSVPMHALIAQLSAQANAAAKRDLVALEKRAREALYGYNRIQKGQFKESSTGDLELEPEINLKDFAATLPGLELFVHALDDGSHA